MSIATFIASQLRKPSGWFGRHVVARILNRGNAPMNDLTARLRDVRVVPGTTRLGPFLCAVGTR